MLVSRYPSPYKKAKSIFYPILRGERRKEREYGFIVNNLEEIKITIAHCNTTWEPKICFTENKYTYKKYDIHNLIINKLQSSKIPIIIMNNNYTIMNKK